MVFAKDYKQNKWDIKISLQETKYLTKELGRMLFNALIQSHLDYACSAWYPNLNEKAKKIQIM